VCPTPSPNSDMHVTRFLLVIYSVCNKTVNKSDLHMTISDMHLSNSDMQLTILNIHPFALSD
jgi:hypothetical protein